MARYFNGFSNGNNGNTWQLSVKLEKIVIIISSDQPIYLRKRLHEWGRNARCSYYNVFVNKINRRDLIV